MKVCLTCKIEKDSSHFHADRRRADGLVSQCKPCTSEKKRSYYLANTEAIKARNAKYYSENAQALKASRDEYYLANTQAVKAKRAKYYLENAEAERARNAKYRAENAEAERARNAKYRAENLESYTSRDTARTAAHNAAERCPAWSDKDVIREVYAEAFALKCISGISYHVDHILPIRGELVSGLHVYSNLQILTPYENKSKNNKYTP